MRPGPSAGGPFPPPRQASQGLGGPYGPAVGAPGAAPPPPEAGGPLPSFYPVLQPGRPLYPEVQAGPSFPYPPTHDQRSGPTRSPRRPGRLRRAVPSRDIAIGCAIAALVIAAFVSAKFLVFGDEPRAEARAAPTGTILVVVRDAQPAEVAIDGKVAGAIRDRSPLTLSSLPAGPHTVRVTRAGAPACEQKIDLASRQAKIVECSFPKAASNGRLILVGVEANQRVFVDDQEISTEAAREPLNLTPAVEHTIQIKRGSVSPAVIEEFSVELEPGQEERRELKSARGGRDKSHARSTTSSRKDDDDDGADDDDDLDADSEPDARPRSTPRAASASASASAPGSSATPAAGVALQGDPSQAGSFTAYTQPFARVFIDGKDTGKMTPIAPRSAVRLAPGTHQVTFVVDEQKFDFKISIEPGERLNMIKTLRPKQ